MNDTPHSAWIVETSDATFEQDVIERSKKTPVVLDFWATWCQPCLLLKPVLEQLADEHQGRFVLVKAEQQSNQKALAEFRIEAFPTVFGVVGGQPVDYFLGLMRPVQLRQWIDRLLQSSELLHAQQLEESDPAAAEAEYRRALTESPENEQLLIGLARVLFKEGKRDESRRMIEQLEARGFLEPEAEKIKAALDLTGSQGRNIAELREQVKRSPNNYAARIELARALAAQAQYEEALAAALDVVEQDLGGAGEDARKLMLEIFQVLPDGAPLKTTYQRKLSAALY
jgi:putative thioredoxin